MLKVVDATPNNILISVVTKFTNDSLTKLLILLERAHKRFTTLLFQQRVIHKPQQIIISDNLETFSLENLFKSQRTFLKAWRCLNDSSQRLYYIG